MKTQINKSNITVDIRFILDEDFENYKRLTDDLKKTVKECIENLNMSADGINQNGFLALKYLGLSHDYTVIRPLFDIKTIQSLELKIDLSISVLNGNGDVIHKVVYRDCRFSDREITDISSSKESIPIFLIDFTYDGDVIPESLTYDIVPTIGETMSDTEADYKV